MANELTHASQGVVLTQAEFEAVGLHVCNSQATGDLIYASSASQLSRLAIGTTGQLLTVSGGIAAWTSTPSGLTSITGAASAISLTIAGHVTGGAPAARDIVVMTGNAANPQTLVNRMALGSNAAQGASLVILYEPLLFAASVAAVAFNDSTGSTPASAQIVSTAAGVLDFYSGAGNNAAPVKRISISNAATAVLTLSAVTVTGLTLSGDLNCGGNIITNALGLRGKAATIFYILSHVTGGAPAQRDVQILTGNAANPQDDRTRVTFGSNATDAPVTWINCYHIGVYLGWPGIATGVLRFMGTTSGQVNITVAAAAGNWTMTLPTGVAGTGGFQLTDAAGDGICTWAAAASRREWKNDLGIVSPQEALKAILKLPLHRFTYKEECPSTGDYTTEYIGFFADEAPTLMHFGGNVLNPITAPALAIGAIQELCNRLQVVEEKLK